MLTILCQATKLPGEEERRRSYEKEEKRRSFTDKDQVIPHFDDSEIKIQVQTKGKEKGYLSGVCKRGGSRGQKAPTKG